MIFYYSKQHKTKTFAHAFGEYLQMDIQPFMSKVLSQKSGLGFMLTALISSFTGKLYPIDNMHQMPTPMPAEIYIASPIWGGRLSAPVRYFLQHAPLQNTKVHLILTAGAPVSKYKRTALDYLSTIQCIRGDCYLFATSSKSPPEKDVLLEQLPRIMEQMMEANQMEANQHE